MTDLWIFIVAVSALFVILSTFIISFTLIFFKRRKQHQDEKLALAAQFKETLLTSQLEIREQTLQNISQELHDNLGQIASLIKINLNLISLDNKEHKDPKIDETKTLTQQLITDLKAISANLNGSLIAKVGLDKGIENEVNRLNRLGILEVKLSRPELFPQLDDQKSIILLRMVQEMLNNILKHSKAKTVSIDITEESRCMRLNLKDDGIGFDVETALLKGGSGLLNLKDRANLIGAQLEIKSAPSTGTSITIETPTDS